MKYCPFCGAELLPGALSFRTGSACGVRERKELRPAHTGGSAQLALPIPCFHCVWEKEGPL